MDDQKLNNQSKPKKPKETNLLAILILVAVLLGAIIIVGYYYFIPQDRENKNTNVVVANENVKVNSQVNINAKANINASGNQLIKMDKLAQAHAVFGFNVLQKLYGAEEDNNIFISPLSLSLALAMAYNGADGQTKTEMTNVLNFNNFTLDQINEQSQTLISNYKDVDPKVQMSIANSIWTREGFTPKASFTETIKNFYSAEAQALDFNTEEAVDTINQWVSDNTREKIKKIVEYPISKDMMMYLINATYFKGTWTYQFDPKLTQERLFTLSTGSQKNHPLMSLYREDFDYLENNDFQAVRLPYGENKRLSMYVFLPKAALADFIASLSQENWQSWLNEFKAKEGTLRLPKIKLEYEKTLNQTLIDLGMPLAFTERADFTKIADNLAISEVKHKTYVDVNEEGTEAAAVTSIGVKVTSIGPDESFTLTVDRPYFFAIGDQQTGENLFLGIVNNPEYK